MIGKRYLLVMWDGGGTVPPELAVAKRLINAGHIVSVLGEDSMQAEVKAAGCRFHAYQYAPNRPDRSPAADPYPDWDGQSPFKVLQELLYVQAAAYAEDVKACCSKEAFDHIVVDGFLIGAMIGAEAADITYTVLWPAVDLVPHPGRPPDGLGLLPGHNVLTRARDQVLNWVFRKVLQGGRKKINALRAKYQLAPIQHPFEQYLDASKVLLLTSRHFDYPIRLPAHTHYAGPQLSDPIWAEPVELPISEPYILVSLGSTYQNQKGLYAQLLESLSRLPLPAIVTLGNVFDPTEFDQYPNIYLLRAAAHQPLLPQCGLVINHGGHGIVLKSIMAGLPQLVIPLGRDQFGNAARVIYHGLGLRAKPNDKPEALSHKIKRLLSESSFTEKSRQMAEKIKAEVSTDPIAKFLLDDDDHAPF